MDNIRNKIVEEARSWLNTPFHHQGRVKGVGVDCVGLVIGVAKTLQLSNFDTHDYSPIPDGKILKYLCDTEMTEITENEIMLGDVVLFKFDERPQHLGIIGEYIYGGNSLIHSYSQARKVIETRFDEYWLERVVSYYRLPGV